MEQRIAARTPAAGARPVMFQRWSNLLFLHWRHDPELITPLLPDGLHVDFHEGAAYIGIIPFFMSGVRLRGLPPVPGLSRFQELNLRTYVHDEEGIPGVWFFSLDAANDIAVRVARQFFHLPYRRAQMSAEIGDTIDYRCRPPDGPDLRYRYGAPAEGKPAKPGSLDFFLLERYHLYAHDPRSETLFRGQVHHEPYSPVPAEVGRHDARLYATNGLAVPESPPCHQAAARGVDVTIYPLRRLTRRDASR